MKKALLMAAALLLAPMAAMAADYKEGVHYTVINDGPETAKPELLSFSHSIVRIVLIFLKQ